MRARNEFDLRFTTGRWAQALEYSADGTPEAVHECQFRAGAFAELLESDDPSVWRALASLRMGGNEEPLPRSAIDWENWPSTAYARTASRAELQAFGVAHRDSGLQDSADLYDSVLEMRG